MCKKRCLCLDPTARERLHVVSSLVRHIGTLRMSQTKRTKSTVSGRSFDAQRARGTATRPGTARAFADVHGALGAAVRVGSNLGGLKAQARRGVRKPPHVYNIYTYTYIYMYNIYIYIYGWRMCHRNAAAKHAHHEIQGPRWTLRPAYFPMFLRPAPQNAEARDRLVELHVFACQGEQ